MMTIKNATLAIAAAAAGLIAAAPANAVITTFASFNTNAAGTVVWRNNGTAPGNPNQTYTFNGSGGTFFTTSSAPNVAPRNAVAGGVGVTFSFLNELNPFIANVPATFTMSATVTNSPVLTLGVLPAQFKIQSISTGSFSFISQNAVQVGQTFYAAGSNLLSANFSNVSLSGQTNSTSGAFGGSVSNGSTISFTSDFLNFGNSIDQDMSLSLTSILSLVNNVNRGVNNGAAANALRSFRATATGSFAADPSPTITANIPEPQTWDMFVIGFGLVGVGARRRKSVAVSA